MSKINILTSEVFNLIAAGEVVERPASVVKELVENSIDAGAKNITIEITDGGTNEIKVIDNGSGIEMNELNKVFLPHATSKIKTAEDLEAIGTLGFRGEALASIAAVSKIEISSCTQTKNIGGMVQVEGGKVSTATEKGCSKGTMVVVKDLFFNVPARAKFLKKPKSEESEITNLVARFILANPTISFKYKVSGRIVFQSTGTSVEDALICVYGKECIENLINFSRDFGEIKISGQIGKPTYSKPNRTYQTIVLNGRYIQNLTIQTAVQNAYSEFLMTRQYPFYVLYITIPTAEVDVNVHPNKMEVRFSASLNMYSKVFEAVVRALHSLDFVPSNVKAEVKSEARPTPNFQNERLSDIFSSARKLFTDDVVAQSGSTVMYEKFSEKTNFEEVNKTTGEVKITPEATEQVKFDFETDHKLVGKFFSTYLVVEQNENIFIIDQHAAHERFLFDNLKNEVEKKGPDIQPLLLPYVFSVNALEKEIVSENLKTFKNLGFEIEEFGKNTYKISTIPVLLETINLSTFLKEVLSDTGRKELSKADLIKDKLMQSACKAAVKAGHDLSENEIRTLLKSMEEGKTPLRCPHGRPAIVRLTKTELEKWFKRVV